MMTPEAYALKVEKVEAKREFYVKKAEKLKLESSQAFERASKLGQLVPFGQPILVGHHSEGRMRRLGEKIDSSMRNGVELESKAEYYENKADNYSGAISSDNPEAVKLLKEKLEKLAKVQELMKVANKKARQNGELKPYDYQISNNNQNMASIKKRIALLEAEAAREAIADIEINGATIHEDKDLNRLQIFFPSIPSEEVRSKLKSSGFRWSPSSKAWQAFVSRRALYSAKDILSTIIL